MSITFKGKAFKVENTHGSLIATTPQLVTTRTHFPGLRGVSEIVHGLSVRPIHFDAWIHDNFDTARKLYAYVEGLRTLVGEHGHLEETGTVPQEYGFCTFDGFEPLPFPGRENADMIPDIAKTVENVANKTMWIQFGRFHFTQLAY